jgi:hypothetical protein
VPSDPNQWAMVTETIYEDMDVLQEFKRLTSQLEIGDDRADYGTVNKHLDRAETNSRKAHRLYLKAVSEKVRWDHANESTLSALRTEAYRSLQVEKDQGQRAKAITDADVRGRMMEMYPDELRSQEAGAVKVKGLVDHCEHLVDCWKSRCRTLQQIISQLRK